MQVQKPSCVITPTASACSRQISSFVGSSGGYDWSEHRAPPTTPSSEPDLAGYWYPPIRRPAHHWPAVGAPPFVRAAASGRGVGSSRRQHVWMAHRTRLGVAARILAGGRLVEPLTPRLSLRVHQHIRTQFRGDFRGSTVDDISLEDSLRIQARRQCCLQIAPTTVRSCLLGAVDGPARPTPSCSPPVPYVERQGARPDQLIDEDMTIGQPQSKSGADVGR